MKKALDYAITASKGTGAKISPIYSRITNELVEEAKGMPPEFLEFYLVRIAELFQWAGTGEGEFPLPPDYKDM